MYQAAPLRGPGPGVSAAAQPPKAREAHAGPRRKRLPDQHELIRHADQMRAPSLAFPGRSQVAATKASRQRSDAVDCAWGSAPDPPSGFAAPRLDHPVS
jgi:hypothetical protein